ncbi:MAG: YgjV family protein [Candidatus Woesearchaeota archaeon]
MQLLNNPFLLSQILIAIALISDIISFQLKKREHILVFLTFSSLLIATHYLFLEEINAAILFFFSFASFITATKTTNKKFLYAFMILYILPITLNYTSWTDLVIFTGLYIGLIARFQKNDKHLRILMMIATSIVITYNAIIFTPMGVLIELVFLSSNIIGYYRHHIKKRPVLEEHKRIL